ncbi:unnamed protein product [Ectocarpus sp. CCAP 1310/34]|nr:unnamed protein product [Ectocarpus sp. CCAP 1310/34]
MVVNDSVFVVDGTVLTVAGADSNAVINGNAGTRLFTVVNAALHVSGVNISLGASVAGEAIAAAGSTQTFDRANFVRHGATALGGVVFVSDGSNASCVGAGTFADNSASIDGGAVYASGGSTISCGASWLNNVAGDIGGTIRVLGGSTISWDEEPLFAYSTAARAGGALSVNNESSVSWNAATGFNSNTAGLVGARSRRLFAIPLRTAVVLSLYLTVRRLPRAVSPRIWGMKPGMLGAPCMSKTARTFRGAGRPRATSTRT